MPRGFPNSTVKTGPDVLLDGRTGFRLAGTWGHVGVVDGGGHVCELVSNRASGINPLWRPPWKTIDPHTYDPGKHSKVYGQPPDGRLLAGIAGHNLSFDHFGPPSKEEIAAGLSTHGEASWRKWRRLGFWKTPLPSVEYGLTLSDAHIRFTRKISVEPQSPVVYYEETANSLVAFDRPICWNEHVTFGPPFLEPGVSTFDIPATRAKVCPASFSSRMFLQPDAEFRWPYAPAARAKRLDLRITSNRIHGRYTAQLIDPQLKTGWFAASNPRLGLLVLYLFRRLDFPWVGSWEERFYRKTAPWKGKTFCRGIEFSTTPFAVPRRESVAQGTLFGEPTYRWLPAKAVQRIRYLTLLFEVAKNFRGVAEVSLTRRNVLVRERGSRQRPLSMNVREFLQ